MNGEVVCQRPSVTILSSSMPSSRLHDEKTTLRLTQEEPRPPACLLLSDGKMAELADGQRSLHCPSDERLSSSQPQPCPRPPAELSNGSPCAPLHSSNNNNNHSLQRRGARAKGMGKKPTRRTGARNSQNRKVTDFYPIRRSSRKSKSELKCEQKKLLDDLITKGIEEGMEVQLIEGKGRGVFATRCFQKGEYVVEYHGDLLHITDAKEREARYAQNPATGCYMYYFQFLCKTYCVDATQESGRLGRLINHSKMGNCQTKVHDINGVPHLILVASRHIDSGEELLYDYGDRSKASIDAHPWLKH